LVELSEGIADLAVHESAGNAVFFPAPKRSVEARTCSELNVFSAHVPRTIVKAECRFTSIEIALRELRAGRMVVVVHDEDRENEGDLMMAAEMITPEAINFMAMHGRGLVCLAMTGEGVDELQLAPMAPDNTALAGTGFTVSIDAKGPGVTTGISASFAVSPLHCSIFSTRHDVVPVA
jgi:hypothetical protein